LTENGFDVVGTYRDEEEFLSHVNVTREELDTLKAEVLDVIKIKST
jgi:hypothetical protein